MLAAVCAAVAGVGPTSDARASVEVANGAADPAGAVGTYTPAVDAAAASAWRRAGGNADGRNSTPDVASPTWLAAAAGCGGADAAAAGGADSLTATSAVAAGGGRGMITPALAVLAAPVDVVAAAEADADAKSKASLPGSTTSVTAGVSSGAAGPVADNVVAPATGTNASDPAAEPPCGAGRGKPSMTAGAAGDASRATEGSRSRTTTATELPGSFTAQPSTGLRECRTARHATTGAAVSRRSHGNADQPVAGTIASERRALSRGSAITNAGMSVRPRSAGRARLRVRHPPRHSRTSAKDQKPG